MDVGSVIQLVRNYDDGEPIILGAVKTKDLLVGHSRQDVENSIGIAWGEFQATEPDCDSDFQHFLVMNWWDQFEDYNGSFDWVVVELG